MLRAMLANRLLRALHRPCCQTAYVYTYMYIYTRVHVRVHIASSTNTGSSARVHIYARIYACTRDTAILRRSANQWRNCKPVHPRGPSVVRTYIHAWISNLSLSSLLRFSFFFFTQSPSTVSLTVPPTLRLNFLHTANPGYEEDLN